MASEVIHLDLNRACIYIISRLAWCIIFDNNRVLVSSELERLISSDIHDAGLHGGLTHKLIDYSLSLGRIVRSTVLAIHVENATNPTGLRSPTRPKKLFILIADLSCDVLHI